MQFECCGVDNYLYWTNIGVTPLPYSCCGKNETVTCLAPPEYTDGCAEKVYEFLEDSAKVIGGVVIGIVATEVYKCVICQKLGVKCFCF